MTTFAKIKFYTASILLFYVVYLFTYKCPRNSETFVEHATQKLIHPFSHQHDKVCGALDTGAAYVNPYLTKAHAFLDEHVHSHRLFKQYQVKSKASFAQAKYYEYVYPVVLKVWQFVELVEYHIAVQFDKVLSLAKGHYHKTVVPKSKEFKDAVAEQAESLKGQIKSKVE